MNTSRSMREAEHTAIPETEVTRKRMWIIRMEQVYETNAVDVDDVEVTRDDD